MYYIISAYFIYCTNVYHDYVPDIIRPRKIMINDYPAAFF